MSKKVIENITDAFLALNEIDDEEALMMVKPKYRKSLREGYLKEDNLSLNASHDEIEQAKEKRTEKRDDSVLQVIDVDADTLEHLKKKEDYVGQAILSCNRCKSNRFVEMDELKVSEDDPLSYNLEDECPHCKSVGYGYELLGQVGKVAQNNNQPLTTENNTEEQTEDELPTLDNDLKDEGELPSFDNFDTAEPTSEPEENSSDTEEDEEGFDFKEEGKDGMETTSSEDEEDDLDLPSLGDEVEEEYEEDDSSDTEKSMIAKNALKEDLNNYADEAWMMNQVIEHMNDEEAYYGSWLYIWPEDEDREQCGYDFGHKESFDELKETFEKVYKAYHEEGLYNAPEDVVAFAHKMDNEFGLSNIDNIVRENLKSKEVEAEEGEEEYTPVTSDLFDSIVNSENLESLIVENCDEDKCVKVFEGNLEDVNDSVYENEFVSFNVADGYLVLTVDCEDTESEDKLNVFLSYFDDEQTEKIKLVNEETTDEIFEGTKAEAIEKFGDCKFISMECPERLCIKVKGSDMEPVESEVEENLFEQICKANNLSPYKYKNPRSNEYWIYEALDLNEDLGLVYERYVLPTENDKLIESFKAQTGYRDVIDEAMIELYGKDIFEAKKKKKGMKSKVHVQYPAGNVPKNAEFFNHMMGTDGSVGSVSAGSVGGSEAGGGEACGESLNETRLHANEKNWYYKQDLNVPKSCFKEFFKWLKERRPDLYHYEIEEKGEPDEVSVDVEYYIGHPDFSDPLDDDEVEIWNPSFDDEYDEELSLVFDDWLDDEEHRKDVDKYVYDTYITESLNEENELAIQPETIQGELVDAPEDTGERGVAPTNMTPEEARALQSITRIARDTADAIKQYYGIDADPALIVADILQDIRLVNGSIRPEDLEDSPINNLTREMLDEYNQCEEFVSDLMVMFGGRPLDMTPEAKLERAFQALESPSFSTENIYRGIGSDRFLAAARQGAVPFIGRQEVLQLESLQEKKCKNCDKEEFKSFKDRKELSEAIQECKNNNRPYRVRRSVVEGYRYDLLTEEEKKICPTCGKEICECNKVTETLFEDMDDIDDVEYLANAYHFAKEIRKMSKEEAQKVYDDYGFADQKPEDEAEKLIYATLLGVPGLKESLTEAKKEDEEIDKITDSMEKVETIIGLIDDEVEAVDGYTDAIETIDDSKIPNKEEIISKLHHIKGEELEHIDELREVETLMPSVGELADEPETTSEPVEEPVEVIEEEPEEFDEGYFALNSKNVNIDEMEKYCYKLGIETTTDLVKFAKEHPGDLMTNLKKAIEEKGEVNEDVVDDFMDLDITQFDDDLNKYFDESYEESYIYKTTSGTFNKDNGTITLKGIVESVDNSREVTFTLTRENTLNEDWSLCPTKGEYKVTNDLSEEVFTFKFENNTPDKEIFDNERSKAQEIIKNFKKEFKLDYICPEMIDDIAEYEFGRNRAYYVKRGLDKSHILSLLKIIDHIE